MSRSDHPSTNPDQAEYLKYLTHLKEDAFRLSKTEDMSSDPDNNDLPLPQEVIDEIERAESDGR